MEKETFPVWFWCSLSQLCSNHRSQRTPGVFHSGSLEVEDRTRRGSVFMNSSTQGCPSSVENLRQCVSKEREREKALRYVPLMFSETEPQAFMSYCGDHHSSPREVWLLRIRHKLLPLGTASGSRKSSGLKNQRQLNSSYYAYAVFCLWSWADKSAFLSLSFFLCNTSRTITQ